MYKIQVTKDAQVTNHFFSNKESEEFIDFLPAHFDVPMSDIEIYLVPKADRSYINSKGIKGYDDGIIGINQSYLDMSESGKLIYKTKTYTFDEVTEVVTEATVIDKEIICTLVEVN